MLHGQRVRLHRNTVCHLEAPGRDFDGELCQVQSYDAAKNKWHIELNGGRHKGKELLVPESSLSFAYCLLAESIGQHKKMVKLIEEGAQGSCGRGLVVAQSVAPGAALFQEPPLLLSSTGPKRMHEDRWRAYLMLMISTQQQQLPAAALAAFDDLGISDEVR